MITGGDELLRSQRCNNNPYNLDSPGDLARLDRRPSPRSRRSRAGCSRSAPRTPRCAPVPWIEPAQVSWRDAAGSVASGAYLDDATRPVLAWRLDGTSLGTPDLRRLQPRRAADRRSPCPPRPRAAWYRVADTARVDGAAGQLRASPVREHRMQQTRYDLVGRSLVLFIAR